MIYLMMEETNSRDTSLDVDKDDNLSDPNENQQVKHMESTRLLYSAPNPSFSLSLLEDIFSAIFLKNISCFCMSSLLSLL